MISQTSHSATEVPSSTIPTLDTLPLSLEMGVFLPDMGAALPFVRNIWLRACPHLISLHFDMEDKFDNVPDDIANLEGIT
jgi:hypothetical protein